MFDELTRALRRLEGQQVSVPIASDAEGYPRKRSAGMSPIDRKAGGCNG